MQQRFFIEQYIFFTFRNIILRLYAIVKVFEQHSKLIYIRCAILLVIACDISLKADFVHAIFTSNQKFSMTRAIQHNIDESVAN